MDPCWNVSLISQRGQNKSYLEWDSNQIEENKSNPSGFETAQSSEVNYYIQIYFYLYLAKKKNINITWITALFCPKKKPARG